MENKIKNLLCELGISDEQSIVPFYEKVRDRDDVSVLKCQKSGVIFLSRSDHINIFHYENSKGFSYWDARDRKTAVLSEYEDFQRRFDQLKNVIANKKWIDIGTGNGGILDLMAPIASEAIAIEPQENARNALIKIGYKVFSSLEDITEKNFDVVTLFHVFEHLTNPMETLKKIRDKMSFGGKVIIEVPHARDFLISFLNLDAFKSFTFLSEHLILHTRDSLRIFLEKAGFSNISIKSFQRYPLANHLYWLAKGKSGGHIVWDHLRSSKLDAAYSDMLAQIDNTDTLIAIATNEK
jgi:SAM-dependent methyltransferase